jgi:hypothetical protein
MPPDPDSQITVKLCPQIERAGAVQEIDPAVP